MNMRRGTRTRVTSVVVATAFAGLLSSCSGSGSDTPSTTNSSSTSTVPAPSTTTPSSSPTSTAAASAIAAYNGYWAAQVRSQANPSKPQDPKLVRYASGKALAGAQSTLLVFRQNGIAMRGAPVLSPTVESVDGSGQIVSVKDCVDSSNWKPIYVATGKSALAPGQAPRVVVDSVVGLAKGSWTVTDSVVHRDQTC